MILDGTITGASAIVRDISDLKRAERELTRLYEQQRHVALTLQKSLMGMPPRIPEIETAHRYLPATSGAGVGGDWFDLIPLGAGRAGVFVGDVMGRGLEAAAVMGQLRSAARSLAKTQLPPQQLMHALDAFAADLPQQLITCCCLVIDPGPDADRGLTVTICSAGHLPVLLVTPGSGSVTVSRIAAPVSVPLGVGQIPHQQASFLAPAGSILALYTDGLVETRVSDLDQQIDKAAAELQAACADGLDLDKIADRVITGLLGETGQQAGGFADDVTLLLVRLPDAPLATAVTEFASDPASVPAGRRFVASLLHDWACAHVTDTATLLTSEILTNAVVHGLGPVRLRLLRTDTEIAVIVSDRGRYQPQPRQAAPTDEAGRGLSLLEMLATSWGVRATTDGQGRLVHSHLVTDRSYVRRRSEVGGSWPRNPQPGLNIIAVIGKARAYGSTVTAPSTRPCRILRNVAAAGSPGAHVVLIEGKAPGRKSQSGLRKNNYLPGQRINAES